LNIKIDRRVKAEADTVANSMGMTLSTAINVFVRQMISERAMPFQPKLIKGLSLKETLQDAHAEAIINGTSEMTISEINEIIADCRREMRGEK
jgi:DNA-damage-inducible protein J